MGIVSSKQEEITNENIKEDDISNLPEQIDDIAVRYILTQNTIDLIRLGDKDYYDNMIILTSSILNKRLNKLQLGFINERIKFGIKEPIYTQDKHNITNLIPKNDRLKDKIIYTISKYYMKIITIYSAIVSTMDPQYFYEDDDGNRKTFYLKDFNEYKNIPHNVKPRISQITNPLNLCRKRLNILKNKLNIDGDNITINPGEKLCSLDEPSKRLNEEIGIKELDLLYYDIYDSSQKKWGKMSKKMKKKYNKDLTLFYQIFTGKNNKPKEIKTFYDIEMLDFKTFDYCNKNHFVTDITVSKNDKLIKKYLDKIYIIQEHTNETKEKLMHILKNIFISNNDEYKINPELTIDKVLMLENETRDIILHLYTTCEKYFIQALLIFEKIFEEKFYNLNIERDNNMKNTFVVPTIISNETIQSDNIVVPTTTLQDTSNTKMNNETTPFNIFNSLKSTTPPTTTPPTPPTPPTTPPTTTTTPPTPPPQPTTPTTTPTTTTTPPTTTTTPPTPPQPTTSSPFNLLNSFIKPSEQPKQPTQESEQNKSSFNLFNSFTKPAEKPLEPEKPVQPLEPEKPVQPLEPEKPLVQLPQ